jgi:hypothetical protein
MPVDLIKLKDANVRRWNAAKLTRGSEFVPVAKRLVARNHGIGESRTRPAFRGASSP